MARVKKKNWGTNLYTIEIVAKELLELKFVITSSYWISTIKDKANTIATILTMNATSSFKDVSEDMWQFLIQRIMFNDKTNILWENVTVKVTKWLEWDDVTNLSLEESESFKQMMEQSGIEES